VRRTKDEERVKRGHNRRNQTRDNEASNHRWIVGKDPHGEHCIVVGDLRHNNTDGNADKDQSDAHPKTDTASNEERELGRLTILGSKRTLRHGRVARAAKEIRKHHANHGRTDATGKWIGQGLAESLHGLFHHGNTACLGNAEDGAKDEHAEEHDGKLRNVRPDNGIHSTDGGVEDGYARGNNGGKHEFVSRKAKAVDNDRTQACNIDGDHCDGIESNKAGHCKTGRLAKLDVHDLSNAARVRFANLRGNQPHDNQADGKSKVHPRDCTC